MVCAMLYESENTNNTKIVHLIHIPSPFLHLFSAISLFFPPPFPSPPPPLWRAGIQSLISGISQAQPLLGHR